MIPFKKYKQYDYWKSHNEDVINRSEKRWKFETLFGKKKTLTRIE